MNALACQRRQVVRPWLHWPHYHEHGPHESDDHAYADEQIGENDSVAALDAHRPSVGRMASPVHPLRCFHLDGPLALGFYSPMVRVGPRLSGFIEPCLPSPAPNPPAGDGWIYEIKLHGFRMLARRDGAGVRLLTRRGNDWTTRYPAIAAAIAALACRS
jgi:ATP-dependent DNA ligase